MSIKSESDSQFKAEPHRNTAESIERGNKLLADAHAARARGVQLRRQSEALSLLSDEAFNEATRKDDEARLVLFGDPRFRRGY